MAGEGVIYGQISWGGVQSYTSCSYSCTHGIAPGSIQLTIGEVDVSTIQRQSDLKMKDGTTEFTIHDCILANVSLSPGPKDTRLYMVTILDRRWKWAFGSISGHFNEKDELNRIRQRTAKSPKELLTLLLDAIGETDYVITGLNPDIKQENWPEVLWANANPAVELQSLCESLGLRIVFRPIEDTVLITPLGIGNDLPDEPYITFVPSATVTIKPDTMTFVGANRVFQVAIPLEAVGMEPDGTIKLIDDLSYRPKDGWGTTGSHSFGNVDIPVEDEGANNALGLLAIPGVTLGKLTRKEYQDLARSCVYRWYRIRMHNPGDVNKPLKIPGVPWELNFRQDVILLPAIWNPQTIQDGTFRTDPPRVYGVYNRGTLDFRGNTTNTANVFDRTFSIDSERGIVIFDQQIKQLTGNAQAFQSVDKNNPNFGIGLGSSQNAPADLVLVTSCYVRNPDTNAIWQYEFEKDVTAEENKLSTQSYIYRHEGVQYVYSTVYSPGDWSVTTTDDNGDLCEAAATYYIESKVREFERKDAGTKTYGGLMDIEPDGKIQEVTWRISGITTTTVSVGTQHSYWIEPYEQRARTQKLKAIIDIPDSLEPIGIKVNRMSQLGNGG